jgi:hypothetical protein
MYMYTEVGNITSECNGVTVAAKKITRHKKLDAVLSIAIVTLLKVVFVDGRNKRVT